MGFITIGFIIILNIVAIFILYQSLGKIDIKNKLLITIFGLIVMYVIIFIIYNISSMKIDRKIVDASRQIILFTILPINTICITNPIMMQIKKLKQNEIDNQKFKTKMIIYAIISIIILLVECMYIKDIQIGIAKFNK